MPLRLTATVAVVVWLSSTCGSSHVLACEGGACATIDETNVLLQSKVAVHSQEETDEKLTNKPEETTPRELMSKIAKKPKEADVKHIVKEAEANVIKTMDPEHAVVRGGHKQTAVSCGIVAIAFVIAVLGLQLHPGTSEKKFTSRIVALDDAKIWAVLLIIFGNFVWFNLTKDYDDHNTWLTGFEPTGFQIIKFISVVAIPTLCFVSGVASQGAVTQERIRRFLIFLVVPTILWTFLIKPNVLGFMLNPTLHQLESSLRDSMTLKSFQAEWYLQALCLWRASTFALWQHLWPPAALASMLMVSCLAGYADFGVVAPLKLGETFGFLPYFAVGYIFPFKAIATSWQASVSMAMVAVVAAVVWVFAVMPLLLWEPVVDDSCLYIGCWTDSTLKSLSGIDHSLYWTRRLSKVVLDLVPVLLLTVIATPPLMKDSPLKWAGPYTLYPFLFQPAANYWRNCFIQKLALPAGYNYGTVMLLHVAWVLVVFVAFSNSYFRSLFDWCLCPAWAEVLLRAPDKSAGARQRLDSAGQVVNRGSMPTSISTATVATTVPQDSPKDSTESCPTSSDQEFSSDDLGPTSLNTTDDQGIQSSSDDFGNESLCLVTEYPNQTTTTAKPTSTWPLCKKPLPLQGAAKPLYKYILPILLPLCSLGLFVFFSLWPIIFDLLRQMAQMQTLQVYTLVLMFVYFMAQVSVIVVRCGELGQAVLPAEKRPATKDSLKHIVVVCAYHEPVEVLQRTLASIVGQEGLNMKPTIVVAMEAKDPSRHATYMQLEMEFGPQCDKILMTEHVLGPGEVAGKGSNENWAVREVYRLFADGQGMDPFQVMITISDADSIFAKAYLNRMEEKFWQMTDGRRFIYNGPMNTYRNLASTSIPIQYFEMTRSHTDTFQQHYLPYTPYSNYSLTLGFAAEIDFWTPDNISEDQMTRIKAQVNNFCSFTTVFVPSFICTDLVENFGDRYVQAKRHQWAAVESLGYILALYPSVDFRCWLSLMLQEFLQGLAFKAFTNFFSSMTTLLVIATFAYEEETVGGFMILIGGSCVLSLLFALVWWLSEYYIWTTCLKEFPINPPSPMQWIFLVFFSPFLELFTRVVFMQWPTLHCLVHAMFHDSLTYICAPKGTEDQRAHVDAFADEVS